MAESNVRMIRGKSSDSGWNRRFDDTISLPRGRQFVTLKDAADHIMKLPKAEQDLAEWQTAIRCLIGAAEGRDFLMHARIGVIRALNRHVERVFNPEPERPALGTAEAENRSANRSSSSNLLPWFFRARALGIETPILNLARTHVAAYEIGRTRAAADDVLTGELHVPMTG
jgi:hypothetical protein